MLGVGHVFLLVPPPGSPYTTGVRIHHSLLTVGLEMQTNYMSHVKLLEMLSPHKDDLALWIPPDDFMVDRHMIKSFTFVGSKRMTLR